MKLTKKQAEEKIKEFFSDLEEKTPEQVRKIKKLAMHHKIKLRSLRKLFCKFCFSPKLKVLGIKNKIKRVVCQECGKIFGWRIKTS